MDIIQSPRDLMQRIDMLTSEDSVCQVFIPGKGQLTIVLQANEPASVAAEVQADPDLRAMMENSRSAHQKGDVMTTTELLKSLSPKDFQ